MERQPFYPFKSEQARSEYEAYCLEKFRTWPSGSATMLIETPFGKTCVRACGRATDPPLVLLPGARSGSLMWTEMIATLSAHHRTYALDIPGDAGSSVSRGEISRAEDLVDWLDEVLTALVRDEPVNLMGISYGGWIAGQYALRHPGRVRSVALLAPAHTVLPLSFAFFARLVLLFLPFVGGPGGPLRRTLRWLFRDAERGSDATRALQAQVISDVELIVRLFALPRPPWPTVIDDEGWRGFRAPCLFVVGENEKIYSARAAVARLNRVAPQVKTEIIPGAGHDMTMVHPDLVLGKVLEFMVEHEQLRSSPAERQLGAA